MNVNEVIIPSWHEINIDDTFVKENGDPLIALETKNNSRIFYEPKYYNLNIPGAVKDCYMRETAYQLLTKALSLLPRGYGFKIFDAWRTFDTQKFLYDEQVRKIMMHEKTVNEAEARNLAKRFVSVPTKDPKNSFVHSTGGAIDLTIVDENGNELNMGTEFDCFSDLANTDYFESKNDKDIKNNRRLLFYVMTSAGFSNFPSEWWHYDYGDLFWAAETNMKISFFGGIY